MNRKLFSLVVAAMAFAMVFSFGIRSNAWPSRYPWTGTWAHSICGTPTNLVMTGDTVPPAVRTGMQMLRPISGLR